MRGFRVRLIALVVLGVAFRVAYALLIAKRTPLHGDGLEFERLAGRVLDGLGYSSPAPAQGGLRPTAEKPPLYPLLLAGVESVTGRGYVAQHLVTVCAGGGTIAAVGLLGRRAAGDAAGLAAAGIAAIYPLFIVTDASLRSESLFGLLVAVLLLAAYRLLERPAASSALMLGAITGLAALTRAEALLFLPVLGIPIAARARAGRLKRSLLVCLACFAVLAPWSVRNWIAFDRPVLISTNIGGVIEGANCQRTYHGAAIGQWWGACAHYAHRNEAVDEAGQRRRGLAYARHHVGRLPVVAAVRVLRTWDLFRPRQQWQQARFFEGRDVRWERLGVLVYYAFLVLAVGGLVVLRRRRAPLLVLVAPAIVVSAASVIGFGFTRFRMAADIPVVVLAAVAVTAALPGRSSDTISGAR